MRRALLLAARAVLLAGPTALAFASGGYFTGARLVALAAAYLVLALALLAVPAPRAGLRGPALAAVGGLGLLAAWTWAAQAWAPAEAPAVDARERVLLYLAAVWAAALAFRPRAAARWAEPVLAAGTVVVIGYGVLGHLGVLDLADTPASGGRLYQPLTYWNAEGALAALGLVLCARLAGARDRELVLRVAAAGAAPLLAAGVYLAFSRGAVVALAVGLAVLVACTPTWAQLRALAIAVEAALIAAVAVELVEGVAGLVPLAAVMLAAAAAQAWSAQAEAEEATRTGPLPGMARVQRGALAVAAVLALLPFAAAVADRDAPPRDPAFGATASRLADAGSFRFAYWEVAVEAFASDPAIGVGAGGFGTEWLARREIDEMVRDAHSLPLETAAELGVVGLALLLLALGGVAAGVRRLVRTDPSLGAGPAAALAVWGAHAAIDWDWEMPALTLVAAVLAGLVVAHGYARPS